MTRIDLTKDLEQCYTASADTIAMVEIPPLRFLKAEGQGGPHTSPAFQQAKDTLFRLSHTLQSLMQEDRGLDWTLMPLEGLWSADDLAACDAGRQGEWQWTLMIRQPDFITKENVAWATEVAQLQENAPPLYPIKFGRHTDGQSLQILHEGPHAEETAVIARLHRYIREQGYHFAGPHHEIYLNDPRCTAPEQLLTILRQPISLEVQK